MLGSRISIRFGSRLREPRTESSGDGGKERVALGCGAKGRLSSLPAGAPPVRFLVCPKGLTLNLDNARRQRREGSIATGLSDGGIISGQRSAPDQLILSGTCSALIRDVTIGQSQKVTFVPTDRAQRQLHTGDVGRRPPGRLVASGSGPAKASKQAGISLS